MGKKLEANYCYKKGGNGDRQVYHSTSHKSCHQNASKEVDKYMRVGKQKAIRKHIIVRTCLTEML